MKVSDKAKKIPEAPPSKQGSAGFTLIEVALALIFISILALPLILQYKLYLDDMKQSETTGNFTAINNAIEIYVPNNAGYPVPASLAAAPGDAEYGLPGGPLGSGTTPEDCTNPTWFTNDGYCTTGGANPVLIGAVPFVVLGINEEASLDYWNNKILYAVTAQRTNAAPPGSFIPNDDGDDDGGISLAWYDGTRTIDIPADNVDYDYILVSTGETARGGYTREGIQTEPCIGATAEAEDENCDLDAVFLSRTNELNSINTPAEREASTATTLAEGAEFYDDWTSGMDDPVKTTWYSLPTFANNQAISMVDRVGIGTPEPEVRLHVSGNIAAENNVVSDKVCNSDGSTCFNPNIIGGTEPQMDCRNSGYGHASNPLSSQGPIIGIGNERVTCGAHEANTPASSTIPPSSAFIFSAVPSAERSTCPAGDLVTGFDADGEPICTTPAP